MLAKWFNDESGTVIAIPPDADIDGTYASWFDEHCGTWALQRPDFHVLGVESDDDGAAALLVDLQHRLTAPPAKSK